MRIDNSYLSSLLAGELRVSQDTADAGAKVAGAAPGAAGTSQHVPSPELGNLQQRLQSFPDSRADVVARVAQLLHGGYYSTADAAQRTADSMIQAIE